MSALLVITVLNLVLLICVTAINVIGLIAWISPERIGKLMRSKVAISNPNKKYLAQIKNTTELVEYLFRYIIGRYIPRSTTTYQELELTTIEEPTDGDVAHKLKLRARYNGVHTYYYLSLLNNLVVCAEYNVATDAIKITKVKVTKDSGAYITLDRIFADVSGNIDFSAIWKIRTAIAIMERMVSKITADDLWYGVDNINAYAFDYIPHHVIMSTQKEKQNE